MISLVRYVSTLKHIAKKEYRINRSSSKLQVIIKVLKNYSIIGCSDDTIESKIKQIESLLNKCEANNKGVNFLYSIDEHVVLSTRRRVIDNIPIDYSDIVNCSLNDIKNSLAHESFESPSIHVINLMIKYTGKYNNKDLSESYIHSIVNTPARCLKEALQRILFLNQILWQTRHTLVGLGRLDKILDRFPVNDDAEDIICDFLKTLHCFYGFKSSQMRGDTGQIIILGGLEEDGSYFCNKYTRLFIKCIKDVNLPDPKCLLRVSQNMPDDLLKMAVDCISTGVGSPLLSNDEVIVPLLIDFGYDSEDAYNYGVSACWEPLAIGKSLEQNNLAHIEFGSVINKTICDEAFAKCNCITQVYELFEKHLRDNIKAAINKIDSITWEKDPIVSLFTDNCRKNGVDISDGGAKYNNYGILSDGLSAAVDSLLNIRKYVFEEKNFSLEEIQRAIISNYKCSDVLKEVLSRNQHGFGTDSDDAIKVSNYIIHKTNEMLSGYRNKYGGKVKFGLSSPSYVSIGKRTGATADGRLAGQPFSTHISRDNFESITELLSFASKLSYTATGSNANVVDIMIQPSLLSDNLDKFVTLLKAAIKMGVFQLQFNVVSYAQLIDAKAHPEKYPNLIVRVWGFSAYFKDLPEAYQDQLILRAKKMEGII